MRQYLDQLQYILDHGEHHNDRTGVGTKSVFGMQVRYDLRQGFPLMTTKKVSFKNVIVELLWFLRGDTNIQYLVQHDVKIWNEWARTRHIWKTTNSSTAIHVTLTVGGTR